MNPIHILTHGQSDSHCISNSSNICSLIIALIHSRYTRSGLKRMFGRFPKIVFSKLQDIQPGRSGVKLPRSFLLSREAGAGTVLRKGTLEMWISPASRQERTQCSPGQHWSQMFQMHVLCQQLWFAFAQSCWKLSVVEVFFFFNKCNRLQWDRTRLWLIDQYVEILHVNQTCL